jgi:hypothetical protein
MMVVVMMMMMTTTTMMMLTTTTMKLCRLLRNAFFRNIEISCCSHFVQSQWFVYSQITPRSPMKTLQ